MTLVQGPHRGHEMQGALLLLPPGG
jgi:hypothetical protein